MKREGALHTCSERDGGAKSPLCPKCNPAAVCHINTPKHFRAYTDLGNQDAINAGVHGYIYIDLYHYFPHGG